MKSSTRPSGRPERPESDLIEVFLDVESRSPLDLKKVGLDRYSAHPETEIQMLAWAPDDEKIKQYFPRQGRSASDMPPRLRTLIDRALMGEAIVFIAHNAQFERIMMKRIWGIDLPAHMWRDTMILAYSWSMPGKLEDVGVILRLLEKDRKMNEGKELIRFFAMPVRKVKEQTLFGEIGIYNDPLDFPDKWKIYCQYNLQDVHAERVIWRKLTRISPMPDFVWWEWYGLDQPMNERGMPARRRMAVNALALAKEKKRQLKDTLIKLTGLKNPLSDKQLKEWLADKGYPWGTVLASYVKMELANPNSRLTPIARQVLTIRGEAKKNSFTKYQKLLDMLGDDDRLRFQFQFGGAARTARWAGRGVQPQNLPKADKKLAKVYDAAIEYLSTLDLDVTPLADALAYVEKTFGPVVDVVVGLIRGVFQAGPDEEIFVSDLNAIENRALGYLAREKEITDVFQTTVEYKGKIQPKCPYCTFGADKMKMGSYMELHAEWKDGDGRRRQIAKPAVLGSGYGQGPGSRRVKNKQTGVVTYEYIMKVNEHGDTVHTGLVQYAKGMGITLTAQEAYEATEAFRNYRGVPQLWKDLEEGFKHVVRTGEEIHVGRQSFRKLDDDGQDVTNLRNEEGRPLRGKWQWIDLPASEVVEGAVMVIDRIKLKGFGTIVRIKLPSSRYLHYLNVVIEKEETVGQDNKPWIRDVIYYEGIEHSASFDSAGAKQKKKAKWGRTKTYGGKLCENVVQAFSRDLLVYGFGLADGMGFLIFGCYHDELTPLVKIDAFGLRLEDLTWCMSQPPPWSPDMVMGAEGFKTKYYRKG